MILTQLHVIGLIVPSCLKRSLAGDRPAFVVLCKTPSQEARARTGTIFSLATALSFYNHDISTIPSKHHSFDIYPSWRGVTKEPLVPTTSLWEQRDAFQVTRAQQEATTAADTRRRSPGPDSTTPTADVVALQRDVSNNTQFNFTIASNTSQVQKLDRTMAQSQLARRETVGPTRLRIKPPVLWDFQPPLPET